MSVKIELVKSRIVSTRLTPFGSHRSIITVFDNSNSFNKTDFYMPNQKKEDPFEDDDPNINSVI